LSQIVFQPGFQLFGFSLGTDDRAQKIIGISCVEESPILWVLRLTGWGLKFDRAKGFVGRPLSCPSSFFLGCIHLSAYPPILPTFLSRFALVEHRHPGSDGLIQLVQIEIGKQGAEISALGDS